MREIIMIYVDLRFFSFQSPMWVDASTLNFASQWLPNYIVLAMDLFITILMGISTFIISVGINLLLFSKRIFQHFQKYFTFPIIVSSNQICPKPDIVVLLFARIQTSYARKICLYNYLKVHLKGLTRSKPFLSNLNVSII